MITDPLREVDNAKGRTVTKSAVTGRFVKKSYAKQHPRTTFKERVSTGKRGKKK